MIKIKRFYFNSNRVFGKDKLLIHGKKILTNSSKSFSSWILKKVFDHSVFISKYKNSKNLGVRTLTSNKETDHTNSGKISTKTKTGKYGKEFNKVFKKFPNIKLDDTKLNGETGSQYLGGVEYESFTQQDIDNILNNKTHWFWDSFLKLSFEGEIMVKDNIDKNYINENISDSIESLSDRIIEKEKVVFKNSDINNDELLVFQKDKYGDVINQSDSDLLKNIKNKVNDIKNENDSFNGVS